MTTLTPSMTLVCLIMTLTRVKGSTTARNTRDADIEPFSLRLRDGDAEYEGRLEIFYEDVWGTICGLGWTDHEGNVACRELGFYGIFSVQDVRHFGPGSGPVLLKDITCLDSKNRLIDCIHSDWYVDDCDENKVVGLRCLVDPPPDPLHELRLVDGNSTMEGRVELYYNGNWGTICGNGWYMADANVVCRQLKLGPPKSVNHFFGAGSGPILISFASCFGHEERLLDCLTLSSNEITECRHERDVGVSCNAPLALYPLTLEGGSHPYEGHLSIHYNGTRGSVCADHWDLPEAEVVCRQLGYGPARQALVAQPYYAVDSLDSLPIHLSDIKCGRYETHLAACSHSMFGNNRCAHYDDAAVACEQPSLADFQLRIVGGNSNYEGRVEIYQNGRWNAICDHSRWDIHAANVACRQMGVGAALSSNANYMAPSIRAVMDHVVCVGTEEKLIDCQHDRIGERTCGEAGVATIQCTPYGIQSIEKEKSLRLAAGSKFDEGRIELYRNNSWGTICSNGWDIADATVACRQLGYGAALVATTVFGEGTKLPVYLTNLGCTGEEATLVDCQHKNLNRCGRYQYYGDAGVVCSSFGQVYRPMQADPYPLRLVGGDVSNEGRLEIRFRSIWGIIAETTLFYWNLTAAHVACRQLGYDAAVSVQARVLDGHGNEQIHLTNIRCTGNEGMLAACSHSQWGPTDIGNLKYDISIVCSNLTASFSASLSPTTEHENRAHDTERRPLVIGIIVLIGVCGTAAIGGIVGVVLFYWKRIRRTFPHLYPGAVRL